MPYRREQLVNEHYYHVLARRVDGQSLFLNTRDRMRFLLSALLSHKTIEGQVHDTSGWNNSKINRVLNNEDSLPPEWIRPEPHVIIEAFILMDSHYHFLVQQHSDNGIQKFAQRLNSSYSKYFNNKHERRGSLFEGPYTAVPIQSDNQLRYVFGYIHLNALDTRRIEWRRVKLQNWKRAKIVLEGYPWSSFGDYTGNPQFPALLGEKPFMRELFPSSGEVLRYLRSWEGEEIKDLPPWA